GTTDVLLAVNFAMFALYPMLSSVLHRVAKAGNSERVALFSLAGAFIAFGIAVFQVVVQHLARAEGYGSNPIPSATVALFLGFFALLGVIVVRSVWRYVFLLGPIAGVATVFLGGSRGPLLAVPALVVVALFALPFRRAVSIGVVVVLATIAGTAFALKPAALGRIEQLPNIMGQLLSGQEVDRNIDRSANIRYRILEGSLAAFRDSPWLGYGWYMKVPAVKERLKEPVGFGDPRVAHLHSDILNLGVSAGIVGLIAYLTVLLAPIVSAVRSPRDSQYRGRLFLAFSLSAGYLCCGAVNLLFGFEFMTTMYVCFAAIFIGYCRDAADLAA
ncbi:MAG TPA: O-antigen ligase family protein, partial [Devosia sp.]|nr:O-antigen ligase family protein [Devosia sp.]